MAHALTAAAVIGLAAAVVLVDRPGGGAGRGTASPGPARRGGGRLPTAAVRTGRHRGAFDGTGGARWATRRDLRPLRVGHDGGHRIVIGTALAPGRRPGRRRRRHAGVRLATERAQSLAVVGPTQSGKTTALAVPAILRWEGPVLAASVKTDLLRDTVARRSSLGRVWRFDPAGTTGSGSDRWSPLPTAATWLGARRVAADLTEVARSEATTADGEFWYATAAKLLAPLLLAAARHGRTMDDVGRWVDTQDTVEVAALLEAAGCPEALQAVQASWLRDERQRSSVYTTAETVLEPFADQPGAGAGADIDPTALLAGRHTLYLCAPAHDQRRLRGLFTALVKQVLEAAFAASLRRGGPLEPPLLVVLDEAANIAPLAELDSLAATCAGHGVQLVTVWQDLAQVHARYGARAPTVINNHRAKLFLSGIADPGTLEHASRLAGEVEVAVPSFTAGDGGRSTTTAPARRALVAPDAVRRLAPGTGLLVYGSLPPATVALQPWWEDPDLTGPPAGGRPPTPSPTRPPARPR